MHIAIIGNGIAGITAARFIRKLSEHDITVISSETDYFFSRTALMYIYMGHMRFRDTQPYEPWFWEKNRIRLLRAQVGGVNFSQKTLQLTGGETLAYDKLLLATGSSSNRFGWPGQDLDGVRGLYSYQDLEYIEQISKDLKKAVIVGGGLIGIELAEMFLSRQIPVSFLVREPSYWNNVLPPEESELINRHIRSHGVDLRLSTELREILDDGKGRVAGVLTHTGERIDCGFVGLTAGVHPNIGFLKESGLETGRGILVDDFLQTNIPDVYAAGDCVEIRRPLPGRRAIEPVWYTGRMMGEVAAYNLCGRRTAYDPGIWFNSAKFFDIEYQIYGEVPTKPGGDQASVYWQHPGGQKSIRLVYQRESGAILGFNLLGIRYRQEVCEKWIREHTPVEEVLVNLGLANFDPEFFRQYEQELVNQYNAQTGSRLKLRQRRGLSGALRFLSRPFRPAADQKPIEQQ